MTAKQKKIMYIVLALVLVVVGYFVWKKYGKSGATTNTTNSLTYTEADVTKAINYIKSDAAWNQTIKDKATKNGNTYEAQLRLDAVYSLEVLQNRKKA